MQQPPVARKTRSQMGDERAAFCAGCASGGRHAAESMPSPEELRQRYPMLPLVECRDMLDGIPERVRQALSKGAEPLERGAWVAMRNTREVGRVLRHEHGRVAVHARVPDAESGKLQSVGRVVLVDVADVTRCAVWPVERAATAGERAMRQAGARAMPSD